MAGKNNTVPIVAGLGAVGIGYYLYKGNGSPKVAEKQFEHDAAKMSSSVRDHLPGREKEAKTEAKLIGQQAGTQIDSALKDAKSKANEMDKTVNAYTADAQKRLEQAKRETGAQVNQAIDRFDNSVEKGASQVQEKVAEVSNKSKGWFGFGGK